MLKNKNKNNNNNNVVIENKINHMRFIKNPYGYAYYPMCGNELIITTPWGSCYRIIKDFLNKEVFYKFYLNNNKVKRKDVFKDIISKANFYDKKSFAYKSFIYQLNLVLKEKEIKEFNYEIFKLLIFKINFIKHEVIDPQWWVILDFKSQLRLKNHIMSLKEKPQMTEEEFFKENSEKLYDLNDYILKGEQNKVVLTGEFGIPARSPMELRVPYKTLKGVFDPTYTPEGGRIGLVKHLLDDVEINEYGFITKRSNKFFYKTSDWMFYNDYKRNLLSHAQQGQTIKSVSGVKVYYTAANGFTHEDSCVISSALAKALTAKVKDIFGNETEEPMRIGDKLAGLHGNKATISLIEESEELYIKFSPSSVPGRMNMGQLLEMYENGGTITILRLNHNVKEKFNYYNKGYYSEVTSEFTNGLHLGYQEIIALLSYDNKNILNYFITNNTNSYNRFLSLFYSYLFRGIKYNDREVLSLIKDKTFVRMLTNKKQITNCGFYNENEEPVKDGILDFEENQIGYYKTSLGDIIFVPYISLRPVFDYKSNDNIDSSEDEITEEDLSENESSNENSSEDENKYYYGSINLLIKMIIEADIELKECKEEEKEAKKSALQRAIDFYYLGIPNNNKMKGLQQLIQDKFGFIHRNLLSFNVINCGTSVIDVNPNLNLDEISLPSKMMKGLGIKENDYVLISRCPVLHRGSMMSFKAKANDGLHIGLNPMVCEPYNADFDGDTMRVFKIDNTIEGIKNDAIKMLPSNNAINIKENTYYYTPKKDALRGIYSSSLTNEGRKEIESITGIPVKEVLNKKTLQKYLLQLNVEKYVSIISNLWKYGFRKATEQDETIKVSYQSALEFSNEVKAFIKEVKPMKGEKLADLQANKLKEIPVNINNIFSILFVSGASGKPDQINKGFGFGAEGKSLLEGLDEESYYNYSLHNCDGMITSKIHVGIGGNVYNTLTRLFRNNSENLTKLTEFSETAYQSPLNAKHGMSDKFIQAIMDINNVLSGEKLIPISFNEETGIVVEKEDDEYAYVKVYNKNKTLLGEYKVRKGTYFEEKSSNEEIQMYYFDEKGYSRHISNFQERKRDFKAKYYTTNLDKRKVDYNTLTSSQKENLYSFYNIQKYFESNGKEIKDISLDKAFVYKDNDGKFKLKKFVPNQILFEVKLSTLNDKERKEKFVEMINECFKICGEEIEQEIISHLYNLLNQERFGTFNLWTREKYRNIFTYLAFSKNPLEKIDFKERDENSNLTCIKKINSLTNNNKDDVFFRIISRVGFGYEA